jgi:hypothetical protein
MSILQRVVFVIGSMLAFLAISSVAASAWADGRHQTTHHSIKSAKKPVAAPASKAPEVTVTTTPFVRNRDVLCVAGCPDGISPPLLVHRGSKPTIVPMLLPEEPNPPKWQQHSTAIFCHNDGGCRSRDFYRPAHGYYDSDYRSRSHRTTVYVIDRW